MSKALSLITTSLDSKKQFNIGFIGDSITSAEWVHPNWREIIEYVLKEEFTKKYADWKIPSWCIRCFNYGFDGSGSADIINFLKSKIIPTHLNLVIYIAGDNDKYSQVSPAVYQQNIQNNVDKLPNSYLILSSDLCSGNSQVNQIYEAGYYQVVQKVMLKNGQFVDLHAQTKQLDLSKFFTFVSSGNEVAGIKPGDIDFIHPNQLGNAYMAKIFLKSVFGLNFDPEKYITTTNQGLMYPKY